MGGPGSGGARAGAGRLRVPARRFCRYCRKPFLASRRARVFCDIHLSATSRIAPAVPLVLRQAAMQLEVFNRQFHQDDAIAEIGRRALAELQVLIDALSVCADVCTDGGSH